MANQQINVTQIYNNLRDNQPQANRKFNGFDFSNFTAEMLDNWINRLNDEFNWKINLHTYESDKRKRRGSLMQSLSYTLNQYRVYEILEAFKETLTCPVSFELIDKIVDYINQLKQEQQRQQQREQQLRDDDEYFNNFNREQYKQIDSIERMQKDAVRDKFNEQLQRERQQSPRAKEEREYRKQRQIERNIQIAKQALANAIELIQSNQHEILMKQNKTKENEELYDYLEQNHHKFKSKDEEYLMVNEPYDKEDALQQYKQRDKDKAEHEFNDKPIHVYYYNNIKSIDDI